MRRLCITCVFFGVAFISATASHIVGGELVFKTMMTGPSTHRIGLNLYFDEINGFPQAEDQSVFLYIFEKSTNRRVRSIQAPKVGRKNINYATPSCSNSSLRTLFISYALDVTLDLRDYDAPEGYYIVWDRCCRNAVIDNILTPGDEGSLFSLFFPPLISQGKRFIDSSPEFSEIQGDYACINADFYIDFNANDADGDSLSYALTTPTTGYSSRAVPSPQAIGTSQYPLVKWADGISLTNAIPGSRPLRIDANTGRITFTAGKLGLYVFSILVKEFRNGELIGSVTRDFQIRVIDCFEALPPKIVLVETGKKEIIKDKGIIRINSTDSACITIKVTDPNFNQLIRIKGRAINSKAQDFSLFPAEFRTRTSNDTVRFQFCVDPCFSTDDNRPIQIELVAEDESCPVPLTDTMRIYIFRNQIKNTPPVLVTSLPRSFVKATPDELLSFDVLGKDADQDSLRLSAEGRGFSLAALGISFPPIRGRGSITQVLEWKPPCSSKMSDTLVVDFLLEDLRCQGTSPKVITTVYLTIASTNNNPPQVRTSLSNDTIVVVLSSTSPNTILFDVIAEDQDTSQISLLGIGRGFDLGQLGIAFQNKVGFPSLSSPLAWTPTCAMLEGGLEKLYTIDFITEDKSCQSARDTATVSFLIKDVPFVGVSTLPNVITPNNDGKNDCFVIDTLPPDNCLQQFREILVFNRWGVRVFQSNDRETTWCPAQQASGTYFYQVHYTNSTFKGTIQLIQ